MASDRSVVVEFINELWMEHIDAGTVDVFPEDLADALIVKGWVPKTSRLQPGQPVTALWWYGGWCAESQGTRDHPEMTGKFVRHVEDQSVITVDGQEQFVQRDTLRQGAKE